MRFDLRRAARRFEKPSRNCFRFTPPEAGSDIDGRAWLDIRVVTDPGGAGRGVDMAGDPEIRKAGVKKFRAKLTKEFKTI